MSFLKILATPLSWLYGFGLSIRHKLFDANIIKSVEFDIPIICVGNITVGGTGKTPHVEYLIDLLSPNYNVAVLSRGYKRRTKGFFMVEVADPTTKVGDEPKQIKSKYPHIPVAVCEKRVDGVIALRKLYPEINLVILDDGFQHRYIRTWANVILMDFHNPIYQDNLLPHGRLRDLPGCIDKADFVLVTKCPNDIKPIDMRLILKNLNLYPYQSLFFTKMVTQPLRPLYPEYNQKPLSDNNKVILMAAVANPDHFREQVRENYNIVDEILFRDHHKYNKQDLNTMSQALNKGGKDCVIITTDKDAVKLLNGKKIPENIKRALYTLPIKVDFVDNFANNNQEAFFNKLMIYVSSNQRHSPISGEHHSQF